MKIFLTEQQVIELAYDALDMNCPDPDKVHEIALRMDMVYNEELDMYEDVEEVSLRKYTRKINELQKALDKLLPAAMNCNHKWIIDTKPTVATKRCFLCGTLGDISIEDLSIKIH